jgi:hypothetical protein
VLGEGWFEGITDGGDAGALENIEERTADGREEVRVLVRVDMGDVNAGALEFLYLGEGFALDVFRSNDAAKESLDEVEQRWAKVFAVGSDERGDRVRRRDGSAIGENDVAAYAECEMGMGYRDGVLECVACCHERGGGECVGLMKFCDSAIDARGEAEVVRVEDEAGSHEW